MTIARVFYYYALITFALAFGSLYLVGVWVFLVHPLWKRFRHRADY